MPLRFFPTEGEPREKRAREIAKEFVDRAVRPEAKQDDFLARFRRDQFNGLAKLGITSLSVPKDHGGQGESSRVYFAAVEEIARASVALAITVGVTNLVQGAIVSFGSDEQKDRFLKPLARGEWLGAFSLSEPGAGSDAAALRLAAKRCPGGYNLSGNKVWCSNAGHADLYLVMARTSDAGAKGITSFLVPKDSAGFRVGKLEKKLGLKSSTLAELIFEDCFLPDAQRLGVEGQGFEVALSQLDAGRIGIGVCGIGATVDALERLWTIGQTVPDLFTEGVKQRFADRYAALQAVKALVPLAADLKDRKERVSLLASQIKLLASDLAMRTTSEAITALGPRGADPELELERLFRDAKALQIVEGTNQIQRMVISREMERMLK